MAIALVSSAGAAGTDSSVTTSAIDTTGATLLVVGIAKDSGGTISLSDSKGNSWTALTATTQGSTRCILYYAANPTVGGSHTFSNTGAFNYSSICVAAFSGVATTTPFDQENGAGASSTTLATGSVTPTEDNELVITHLAFSGSGLPTSIDGGFTETNDVEFGGGNNYGSTMAYLIQTTAAAANPTWTRTNSNPMATRIATFKAAATSAVKTINGLARASVKTLNGLAIASVKTVNGLT